MAMDASGVGNGAALLLGSSNYKRELSTLIYVHDVLVKRVFEYQISHNTHPSAIHFPSQPNSLEFQEREEWFNLASYFVPPPLSYKSLTKIPSSINIWHKSNPYYTTYYVCTTWYIVSVHKSNSLYFRCLTVAKKDGSMEVWERETFKHDDGLCHCC